MGMNGLIVPVTAAFVVKFRKVAFFIKLHLRVMGCASLAIMGSHSVTCHPTQENTPRLNPSQRPVLDLPIPDGWMGG